MNDPIEGEQSKALLYASSAEQLAWKVPQISDDTPTLPIRKVGVVGAGTMGGGIAMAFANAGIPVTILDTDPAALDRGLAVVRRNYERSVKSGRLKPEELDGRMSLLDGRLDIAALTDADVVVEAVFEDIDVKREVFGRLTRVVRPDALLASNTSYLDIDEIARSVERPERFLGLHFFSPANVMRLLEVVRGEKTSLQAVATAMQLARRINKVAVLVGVCHGFVGNRMLAQRSREANALILEGAMPWQVDKVLTDFGMAMGPFAMRDLAGLDIGWSPNAGGASDVRGALCELGRLGQKSGAGFYDYDENRQAAPSAVTEQVIVDFSRQAGVERRPVSDQDILERCLYPMVNEGAKILEEGKALRASDIDVVWLNGYGWPRWRGGPMWWADSLGLDTVLDALRAHAARGRTDLRPAALLEQLARDGRRFQDLA